MNLFHSLPNTLIILEILLKRIYMDTTILSLYYILCLKQIKSSILLVEKLKQVMVPYMFTMDYIKNLTKKLRKVIRTTIIIT